MVTASDNAFIKTIKERCRVCYTCVRECPAKAIRIADGQAEIMPYRCIGCGNCVRVCSQKAKLVISSIDAVEALLKGDHPVAACLAPSFPAEFPNEDYSQLVGKMKALGFRYVHEVAFGADLVARQYRRLLREAPASQRFISTACPAVIRYVEKYLPGIVPDLAPIVSPMIAQARVIRRLYGPAIKVVFIGPCIAKKSEAASLNIPGEVHGVLTFRELHEMFELKAIDERAITPADFDPPHPRLGGLFPISRGLLQAADVQEDLVLGEVVASDGNKELVEAIRSFASGALDARLLDILCCNGCIMGAGMSDDSPIFSKRSRVSRYVRHRMDHFDIDQWQKDMDRFADLDLSRIFVPNDQRLLVPQEEEVETILARMGKFKPEDELNCGACGYDTCREHAIAILKGLAESEMCLPHTIDQLRTTIKELAVSNEQLADAQHALVQSEKLASMGQLAAGIAHEVNNPLGVVLMYAHLLLEEAAPNTPFREDLKMISEQADRCKKIVAGLLHFARQNKVVLTKVNLKELIDRVLHLMTFPSTISTTIRSETDDVTVELDADQIQQVLTNLITNAVAAMPDGGQLTFTITGDDQTISFSVADTGVGISEENKSKIFEPFFTTKQMGKGTGLGLAVSYGIVKMHRGDIGMKSNNNPDNGPTGTTFIVTLPRQSKQEKL